MPATVAMYDASFKHIGERLDALGLDIEVVTFDKHGKFRIDGVATDPAEVAVDYMWLSAHLNADKAAPIAFETALACKSVGVLQTFNAGLDNPVYARIAARGVRLLNSSAQGVAIAEYVMGQALAVLQPIEAQRRLQAEKTWRVTRFREISRTNWLIFGYGPIGEAVARRAAAFEAGVAVVRRSSKPAAHADRTGVMADAKAFAADADVIVLACPLNDETRGTIDAAFFAAAKPGAILINVARGGLIDDAALIAALDDGRIGTAVLDVFHREPLPETDPLWTHPKVRTTPHTSFAGDGVQPRWDRLFLDNIQRFCAGEPLRQEVDPADLV